ncbi:DNA adenine methylase [Desulfosporosinus sp. FKB]|uniref:DNA adenine methylase n=1 Tax=Desulfosporosinus sp. FKB TaxID=1969835 RepID=UPI000B4A2D51|nr:DNA adenine methylase [Desulfosporosinus sp. FKB]
MPATVTPLRYPGGKTKLYDFVLDIIKRNHLEKCTYIEPFAGGAGLALKLLFKKNVSKLILNDLDNAVYSFWYSILNYTEEFCRLIELTSITIEEREHQKYIYKNQNIFSTLEVGFASFFLNRTNISGILHGGPIGGADQKGSNKLDARFNKKTLIEKLHHISLYKNHIRFYNYDVNEFIERIIPGEDPRKSFIYFDPPYVKKGPLLYMNCFKPTDHSRLAEEILRSNNNWIVTYDNCEFISNLYRNFKQEIISINYSAGSSKKSEEIVIYSPTIH